MKRIIEEINKYDTIMIHGHLRPDGDCIGSQIGLREMIRSTYPEKKCYAVGPMSDYVSFLGEMDVVVDEMYKGSLAIVCDCGNSERISDQRYKLADKVIKIDHHVPIDDYGDINYVESEMSSCCEVLVKFMEEFGLNQNENGAIALFTGILTDTGRFRFDSVNGDTFRRAGKLIDLGVAVDKVDSKLSVETIESIKLKGYVLSNFKTTDAGFAYILMTRDVINKFGITDEQAASQVSTIGNIDGYPIWALIMEYPGEIRIRLRSRSLRIDQLANKYQGGGHHKASGAKLNSWDELPMFIKDVDELLKG